MDGDKGCGTAGQFVPLTGPEVVRLRLAGVEDAAALGVIGTATFAEAYAWALPGADIVDFCVKHHTTAAYAYYLAKPDTRITLAVTGQDAPVGYAMVCAPDMPGIEVVAGDCELKRIYLLSHYRPGGNGQRLMDAAMAEARGIGARRMLLGTNAGNVRAIAFYRRNGFEQVGTRTFVVGVQHCCDVIFGKVL